MLSVTDQGIGIATEDQMKLLQAFQRMENEPVTSGDTKSGSGAGGLPSSG